MADDEIPGMHEFIRQGPLPPEDELNKLKAMVASVFDAMGLMVRQGVIPDADNPIVVLGLALAYKRNRGDEDEVPTTFMATMPSDPMIARLMAGYWAHAEEMLDQDPRERGDL